MIPAPGAQATHVDATDGKGKFILTSEGEMILPRKASAFSSQQGAALPTTTTSTTQSFTLLQTEGGRGRVCCGINTHSRAYREGNPVPGDSAESGSPEHSEVVSISGQRQTETDFCAAASSNKG